MIDKPYLSCSRINMHNRCPEAYRRRYEDGEIIPPGIAAITGSGVHAGAEANFRQKIESREDLPANEIVDAAVAGFEGRIQQGVFFTDDENSVGPAKVIGSAKDDLVSLAGLHAREQAPDYQPVEDGVEATVRVPISTSTHDLLGVIDLIDENDVVTDFKTAARRKAQAEADTSIQLTFYSAAHQIRTGRPPSDARLDVLVKNKKPVRQVVSSSRGPEDYAALSNRTNATLAAIKSGVFPPGTDGWWCSAKYCGYHATCPFVRSGPKSQGD